MDESPLIEKLSQEWRHRIIDTMTVSYVIDNKKTWNNSRLNNMLSKHIVDKITSIPIPMNDNQDKLIWKFTTDEKFTVKTAIWTNNDKIFPYSRSKLLNYI